MTGQQTIDRANELVTSKATAGEITAFIKDMYNQWTGATSGEQGWRTKSEVKQQTGRIYGQLKSYLRTMGA